MKVYKYPSSKPISRRTVLVLGAFESFHLGHLTLLEEAKKQKLPITLMLISNPEKLPKHQSKVYASLATRLQIAANAGVAYAIVVSFTPEISALPGEAFLKKLVSFAHATHIVVGGDFALGRGRDFSAANIKNSFKNVSIVEPLKFDKQKLSTSVLRELVEVGDLLTVSKLAMAPFSINARLNEAHFFTWPEDQVSPHPGIYVGNLIVNDLKHAVVIRVGLKSAQLFINFEPLSGKDLNGELQFLHQIRTIIKADQDFLSSEDQVTGFKWFARRDRV